ncbi:putative phosphohydrolase [Thermanaerovibrio velox DSM 12556]|uniref:Putative phosphohydrolase n=1 Tax=Thermanaerovibrio velox DSM 12556 TaxID=926567 RepID=H0UQR3_9BACT|nr:metallophosphoesterase [Thermanaerovibrio velox]EHM10828.1 putative phosphohydrolase [Thermanaerovibrio velox DSM 12556]
MTFRSYPPGVRRGFYRLLLTLVWVLSWTSFGLPAHGAPSWGGLNGRAVEEITSSPAGPHVSFLVVGDTRGPGSRFGFLVPQMRDDKGEFLIHLGDLTNRGTHKEYQEALGHLRGVKKPFLVVVGNHELVDRGRPRFEGIFGSRRDIWFRRGDVLFLLLDNADGSPLPKERLERIKGVLSSDAPVKLVFMHQPLEDPRGEGFRHAMDPKGAAELLEVFKSTGVSHIFASHVHGFFQGHWGGIPFTVSGGGGAKLYSSDPDHGFYHYHRVTAGPEGVAVETVPMGGYVR